MEMKLRPYKAGDARTIISWIKDETALRKWSSDRYGAYPITAQDINYKYLECNGDCVDPDNFYPMTAVDGDDNGFLIPNLVNQRIRSYSLSEFAKCNEKKILSKISNR